MSTTPVDRLAHLGRALLLAGALLALGVSLLWTQGEEWVRNFDAETVDAHIAPARDLDARTRAPDFSGSNRYVKVGLEVNGMLKHIRPGERLELERRRALEQLTRHQQQLGNLPEALESAREWVKFDPLSVRAVLELAELLGQDPDLAAERLEVLGELFTQLPEVDVVARAWCELLMDEGLYLEAVDAALLCDRQARPNLWRVRWKRREAATSPFQAMVIPSLTAEGELVLECTIAGPAVWISIELPPGGACTLVDPVLTITKKGGAEELVLAEFEGSKAVSLEQVGSTYTQAGELGSRFEIEPGGAALDAQPQLTLRAGFSRPRSAGLLAVALHAEADRAYRLLAANDREGDLALLSSARLSGLRAGSTQLYWRKRKGGFTATNSVRLPLGGTLVEGGLEFELEFPIAERASLVRLDLPEGLGVSYELNSIEVVTSAERHAVDVAQAELELLHSLDRDGSVFTVTGKDPWLALALPGTVTTVERLLVRGVAR